MYDKYGRWDDHSDCDLMNYAIQLSHNLLQEGAITVSAAASHSTASRGCGRSSGPVGLSAGRWAVKHRTQAHADGQASGPYVRNPNRQSIKGSNAFLLWYWPQEQSMQC